MRKRIRNLPARWIVAVGVVMIVTSLTSGTCWADGSWTTLDYSGASSTSAHGIDGSLIAGTYSDSSGTSHGFVYDVSAGLWTAVNSPGDKATHVYDIDGSVITGYYYPANSAGFTYDTSTSTWTTWQYPGSIATYATGYDNGSIVGYCDGHGFLYRAGTWTPLYYQETSYTTWAMGIDGDNIVGHYLDGSSHHGFLYDQSEDEWTDLDYQGATNTYVRSVDGDTVVGYYTDDSGNSHGFLYSISTGAWWEPLDYDEASSTYIYGVIDGVAVVGSYTDGEDTHGFLYEFEAVPVPVPGAVLLGMLGLGYSGLRLRRWA